LLHRYGDDIPVGVAAIVSACKVTVRTKALEYFVSGLLLVRGDDAVIGVNAGHYPNRRRFTIAHELGHFHLHLDRSAFFLDASPVFFRQETTMSADHDQEREANAFAAELLIPARAVRSLMATDPIAVFDEAAVKQMANRFGVRTEALVIRLTELDLVLPQQIGYRSSAIPELSPCRARCK
jgi:Zn-dependent peptidase ImmA (M78 family)